VTPDSMRLQAVADLADEFDRTHTDARGDADRFITALQRQGWTPQPARADRPAQARTAPRPVAERYLAEFRQVVAEAQRRQGEGGAG